MVSRAPRRSRRGRGERRKAPHEKQVSPGAPSITGELRLHRDGYGFVVADRPGQEDLFIPARFVGDALHSDLVEARLVSGRGAKTEGRIMRIVERRLEQLMGRLERHGRDWRVVADDLRVRHQVTIPGDKIGGARHGDNVVVRIVRYPSGTLPMAGEVVQVLGVRGLEGTEKAAIITKYQLRRKFTSAVQREAQAARSRMDEAALSGREDLRHVPFVTIDGEHAQDFDDAVAVKRLGAGLIRLWVSIADVSHFVAPHTALDAAAYERGTSVYFPSDCLPMLPEELSTDLCSLRPNVDRLTVTAQLDVAPDGRVVDQRFYRSIIRSRERMTYTTIKKILVERDPQVCQRYGELVSQFGLMGDCLGRLRARRIKRGSIDFDLPEPEIVIDMQGDVTDILRAERHVGHMMIEEFMIAANEAVAQFLTQAKVGCVYRVHGSPEPEALREFSLFIRHLGIEARVGAGAPPRALARVVEEVKGKPEERMVNHAMLRSMLQAVYSSENLGHYGLASKCYCHFTSPIRRYPDLLVHRLLTEAIPRYKPGAAPLERKKGESRAYEARVSRLQEMAEHCSRRERVAMEAEREMAKFYAALFMQGRTGEEFDGVISHVAKFGFFVELADFFVEGLVHINSLEDDRYQYDEDGILLRGKRTKRVFRVGDRVRVEVEEVDIPNREILFTLVSRTA
jgi:ribonuclease R